jgi:hypothetical protein
MEMKKKPDLKEYLKKYKLSKKQKSILTDFYLKNEYYFGFVHDLDALANCLHENEFNEAEFELYKESLENEDVYMVSISEHDSFDDLMDENMHIYFHHVYAIDNVDKVVKNVKIQLYYDDIESADINIFKVSWDGDIYREDLVAVIEIEIA